jgi:hypothetical protein
VAGEPIALRPHVATAPGETIESHAWSFGDGASSAKAKPKHVYDKEGLYLAELRVNTRFAGSPSSAAARVVVRIRSKEDFEISGECAPTPGPRGTFDQTPASNEIEQWRNLTRLGASLIARATVVEDSAQVIDPRRQRFLLVEDENGRRFGYSNTPRNYVVGTLVRLRLDVILKTTNRQVAGDVVEVFRSRGAGPRFAVGDELFVFLTDPPLLDTIEGGAWTELYGTTIESSSASARPKPFDPATAYSFMGVPGGWRNSAASASYLKTTTDNLPTIEALTADLALGDFQAYMPSPRNGWPISGSVELVAGHLGRELLGAQFKLDGVDIGPEVTEAPYRMVWDSTAAADGLQHELRVVIRDASGATATSPPVIVAIVQP